jgi:hypothetical protein
VLYPSADAGLAAATGAEFVLLAAAEALARLDEGLPQSPTRMWLADDEVADLARQLKPLPATLPADVAAQVGGEFAAAGTYRRRESVPCGRPCLAGHFGLTAYRAFSVITYRTPLATTGVTRIAVPTSTFWSRHFARTWSRTLAAASS